jgi:hypothetical protein
LALLQQATQDVALRLNTALVLPGSEKSLAAHFQLIWIPAAAAAVAVAVAVTGAASASFAGFPFLLTRPSATLRMHTICPVSTKRKFASVIAAPTYLV